MGNLRAEKKADVNPYWACYHTRMFIFQYGEIEFGIIGYAVGSSFSVLIAEELFASGCQLLISMSSAGQIVKKRKPPYFILIQKALRVEMEAAALYAFAEAREKPVICFAHVTNQMGSIEGDFEKGSVNERKK